ncbi:bifunctional diguanylate cyclase/phosphodiesterase [Chitinibacteraceae bacterium HSL-7]
MTLLRQLILVIVVLFVVLFTGTVYLSVRNTQTFLDNQLSTISDDTATSLALSVSPHVTQKDWIMVESMVKAVFDGGYYREVSVLDVAGKPVIERQATIRIDQVPQWFIRMFPLGTPRGEALISAGWLQAGSVVVSANPGLAYATLWHNSVEFFWWFLGVSLASLAFGLLLLHFILRPLAAVEEQAKAICDREYPVQRKIPWTLELRSVVEAMNRMTQKVRDMFAEQAEAMERVQSEAYRDAVSQLPNRRHFDMQLKHLVDTPEEFSTGALLFIELHDIKKLNEQRGYQAVDTLIAETAKLLETISEQHAHEPYLARLAGGTFAIIDAGASDEEAKQLAGALVAALPSLHEKGLSDESCIGHVGVARYSGQGVAQLLSEADLALRTAQSTGQNALHIFEQQSAGFDALTQSQWRTLLDDVIQHDRIELHLQPVHAADSNDVLHHEVLLRIRDAAGALIPAGLFIPMAKRLDMVSALDRLVVSHCVRRIAAGHAPSGLLSINVFPASIQDSAFVQWLTTLLEGNPEVKSRLMFEVPEYGVAEQLEPLRAWVDVLYSRGVRTAIDHFGRGLSSFSYLSTLKIDCLKVDGSYIRGIAENKDNQFLVDSLLTIAHGLDLTVIAESVEHDEDIAMLRKLGMDGVQGFGIAKPFPWQE